MLSTELLQPPPDPTKGTQTKEVGEAIRDLPAATVVVLAAEASYVGGVTIADPVRPVGGRVIRPLPGPLRVAAAP